jgi:multidrug efflux pump subunit AcrA (membrane-fusion protein)
MKSAILRGGATLLAAAIIASGIIGCQPKDPVTNLTPTPEPPSPVTAKATILPGKQARLSFQTLGRVAVLPKVGDRIDVGQEIARLDTAELDLAVAQASDAVSVSQALLAQAQAPARDVDLAALESAYQAAVARHNQLLAGGTAADLAAAKAAVASAESGLAAAKARLQQVKGGATASELAAAEGAVSTAKGTLATAKARQDALDPNGTQHAENVRAAELALEQAKNTLWSTQVDRDATKGSAGADSAAGKAADARVAAAETAVTQAQNALELKQKPPTADDTRAAAEAVAAAEKEQSSAQAQLDQLHAGPVAADLGAAESGVSGAEAALAAAKARLDTLQNGGAPGDKEASAALVAQAKAALDLRKAGPAATDLDVLNARLKQSQTALAQAKAARAAAVIVSPLAGAVVATTASVGETVTPGASVVTVADFSKQLVETTDLDEAGAAMLKVGMPVTVRVNAFADKSITGKIDEIASVATTTSSGDANYTVRIALDQPDPALRLGMTARVEFPVGR